MTGNQADAAPNPAHTPPWASQTAAFRVGFPDDWDKDRPHMSEVTPLGWGQCSIKIIMAMRASKSG